MTLDDALQGFPRLSNGGQRRKIFTLFWALEILMCYYYSPGDLVIHNYCWKEVLRVQFQNQKLLKLSKSQVIRQLTCRGRFKRRYPVSWRICSEHHYSWPPQSPFQRPSSQWFERMWWPIEAKGIISTRELEKKIAQPTFFSTASLSIRLHCFLFPKRSRGANTVNPPQSIL